MNPPLPTTHYPLPVGKTLTCFRLPGWSRHDFKLANSRSVVFLKLKHTHTFRLSSIFYLSTVELSRVVVCSRAVAGRLKMLLVVSTRDQWNIPRAVRCETKIKAEFLRPRLPKRGLVICRLTETYITGGFILSNISSCPVSSWCIGSAVRVVVIQNWKGIQ